jgi:hypothetical protein
VLSGTMPVLPITGRGSAAWAAAKAGPFSAVLPRSGTFNAKSPSCGMHSFSHTSQLACSLIVTSLASGEGLKSGVTVSGTGSSTVFS